MKIVDNVRTYGLLESIVASGYPMKSDALTSDEFVTSCKDLVVDDNCSRLQTASKLAQTDVGTGHDNFLNGIVVQFDLSFTTKAWVEAERYHFFDFVSSMSTIHRLDKMDFDLAFNGYVTEQTKSEMIRLRDIYRDNPTNDNRLALLYNCPTGIILTARMTTNYRQLKTIYRQRKNHLLPEWREFCRWIETLPMSKELVTNG